MTDVLFNKSLEAAYATVNDTSDGRIQDPIDYAWVENVKTQFYLPLVVTEVVTDTLGVLANIVAVITLIRLKPLKASFIFLTSLAVSDFLYPFGRLAYLFHMKFGAAIVNNEVVLFVVGKRVIGIVVNTALIATLLASFCITIDRLIAVVKLQYLQMVTKKRVSIVIAVCWWIAVLIGSYPLIATCAQGSCILQNHYFENRGKLDVFVLALALILCAVLVAVYIYIFVRIRKHRQAMQVSNDVIHEMRRGTVTAILIVATYVACVVPGSVYLYVWKHLPPEVLYSKKNFKTLMAMRIVLVNVIMRLNFLLDPVIYLSRNTIIRDDLRRSRLLSWSRRNRSFSWSRQNGSKTETPKVSSTDVYRLKNKITKHAPATSKLSDLEYSKIDQLDA